MGRWKEEIDLACDLYNRSLVDVREFIPVPRDEFHKMAESIKPIVMPDLVWVAEISGKPVGFVLALPDVNEVLQPLNGRIGPLDALSLLWRIRHTNRASFKILVMLPEYQSRGIETVLIYNLGQGIVKHKFSEVDMSLTGDDNPKSSLFQDHLGFKIYRRYRVYQKDL
jgi:GNAT superfamily N-acetyltransferase